MNWETYIAFGDSITFGARTYLGYPEVTGSYLAKAMQKDWNIINQATNGFTAIDLARYINDNYTNLKNQQSSMTSILIGTNDVKRGTSLLDFEIALEQVVIKSKIITQNANVVLIQIPDLKKGIMYPYNLSMNDQIAEFNELIIKLALNQKVKCIKVDLKEEHFLDGVHLNALGIQIFGQQVANFILSEHGC